jgi:uncharacterized protein HemX
MKFLTRPTLIKKTVLFTALGLLLGVGLFSFWGIRAVEQATETMLQDQLTTAQLMADYVDEALEQALNELTNTAQRIEISQSDGNFETEIGALENTYSRQGQYIFLSHGQPGAKQ